MDSSRLYRILIEKCKRYDVISFDIFDTLLKRDVMAPTDVFKLIEIDYDQKNGCHSCFAQKRITAEYNLRKAYNLREVTLDEIYGELDFSPEQCCFLKNRELEFEKELLHMNPPMKKVFEYCVQQKKTIYLISDMYLPLSFLKNILQREGYTGYKRLYLSCDCGKTKRTGELFRFCLQEEDTKPQSILHIGDSIYADVIGAKRAGIRCHKIPTNINQTLYYDFPKESDTLSARSLFAFINNHGINCISRPEQLGYELLGPLIYGYCVFLHKLPERKGRKIWMAARDMYLFEQAYRMLFPEDDFEYVYLSRKSLRPIYTNAVGDLSKAGEAFPDKEYTLFEIIEYMGYDPEAILQELRMSKEKRYNGRTLGNYSEVRSILQSPQIEEQEAMLAKTGYRYLDGRGLFSDDIILADVGWHGTIQLLLEKIRETTGKNRPLFGCYIGSCEGISSRIGKEYCNWLFDENDDRPFMRGIVLFETMILAPHGSTIRFAEGKSGEAEPILGKPDNVSDVVKQMQNGALRFISEYRNSLLATLVDVSPEFVCKGFEKFETKPLKEELDYIGDLDYENYYKTQIAKPKSLKYYLFHMGELKHDFMFAGWRTGFLYRLFCIRLPYAKLYELGRWSWRKRGKKSQWKVGNKT